VRCIGCAALGAVLVVGGAENVREPREPELEPPPTRASAIDEIATDTGRASAASTAKVLKEARKRFEDIIVNSYSPRHGDAVIRWACDGESEVPASRTPATVSRGGSLYMVMGPGLATLLQRNRAVN
jgi:hypothetical protein